MSDDKKGNSKSYQTVTDRGFGQLLVLQKEGGEELGGFAIANLVGYQTPEFSEGLRYPVLFCADADGRQPGNPLTNPLHASWHLTETRLSPDQLASIQADIRNLGSLSPDRGISEKAALELHARYCRSPIS